jgi:hypothetical protein
MPNTKEEERVIEEMQNSDVIQTWIEQERKIGKEHWERIYRCAESIHGYVQTDVRDLLKNVSNSTVLEFVDSMLSIVSLLFFFEPPNWKETFRKKLVEIAEITAARKDKKARKPSTQELDELLGKIQLDWKETLKEKLVEIAGIPAAWKNKEVGKLSTEELNEFLGKNQLIRYMLEEIFFKIFKVRVSEVVGQYVSSKGLLNKTCSIPELSLTKKEKEQFLKEAGFFD